MTQLRWRRPTFHSESLIELRFLLQLYSIYGVLERAHGLKNLPLIAEYLYNFIIGCKLLLYPGAFNMTTGPAHWELLIRSR
jgi:hypothetical protein